MLSALVAPLAAQGSTYNPTNPENALVAPGANVGGEAGHGSWSARLGLFDMADDGDGNPFLDEDLTVIEPVFLYQYNVSEDTTYSAQISYDNVSSASIERLSKFDDQTGATGTSTSARTSASATGRRTATSSRVASTRAPSTTTSPWVWAAA